MAKGTVRVQLTAAQVKVVIKALTTSKKFEVKEAQQAKVVVLKLKK